MSSGTAESATVEQLARLERILSRDEFRTADPGALEALVDPLRIAMRAAVRDLIGRLDSMVGGSLEQSFVMILGVAALLAVALTTIYLTRASRGTLVGEAEMSSRPASALLTAAQALQQAELFARSGDLRAAIHHRYLAVLLQLDEAGLVAYDRSLTNREHVGLAVSHEIRAALGSLVAEFDGLWYGQASCTPAEYARFSLLADRVWQAHT